jgi:RHS repeat-associated protein
VITNSVANNYKFTGLERDTETGLDHTLNRQYSSNFGHWLSPDRRGGGTLNPQSLNRYTYALNNPCTHTDRSGLCYAEMAAGGSGWSALDYVFNSGFEGGGNGDVGTFYTYFDPAAAALAAVPSSGGGGCTNKHSPPTSARKVALNEISSNKDCQNFIISTIAKAFELRDHEKSLTPAQQAADTVQAFEKTLEAANIVAGPPAGLGVAATPGLSTITTTPFFNTLALSQQGVILLHETFHLAPPGGSSYFFSDEELAAALGLAHSTGDIASTNFEKELEKHCLPKGTR